MSDVMDSLRTRIAAAMYRHSVERLEIDGIKMWDQLPESVKACWYPAADAVIRELGNLRQEPHRFQCGSDDCSRYRIISDWTANV